MKESGLMKKKTVAAIALLGGVVTGIASVCAIDIACKKDDKKQDKPIKNLDDETIDWLNQQEFIDLEITSDDHLKLRGHLLLNEDKNSNRLLIAIHGYRSYSYKEYSSYIRFYHDLGFHILLPDNRAHGESEGKYIGFGWLDRLDCMKWIDTMKKYFDKDLQIVLHGISMGSATVLMASGEKLPDDVKCIISDCGFTSVYEQFKHVMSKSPITSKIILPISTLFSKQRVGYNFKEASALKQVQKSHTPTLFIHGDQDDYVPTYMVHELYNACSAPKDLLIVEGAKHANSYFVNKELCEKTITEFIHNYVEFNNS